MTRETRIGLLVGLVFIVMFGLVLSELTGTSTPQPPPSSARSSDSMYAWTPIVQDAPAQTTHTELAASNPQAALAQPAQAPTAAEVPATVQSSVAQAPVLTSPQAAVVESRPMPPGAEEVQPTVVASPAAAETPVVASATPVAAPAAEEPAPPPSRTYVVEPKDSLIKIARKVYGPQHEREYKRILEANRDTLDDEESISVGQKLVIPPLPEDKQVAAKKAQDAQPKVREMGLDDLQNYMNKPQDASSTPQQLAAAETSKKPADAADASATAQKGEKTSVAEKPAAVKTYVVQKGDTLSKIARKTLNDDSKATLDKIYNANKGKLSRPDRLKVGMKLEIPT
jgi:nucleoid-associated protein YgaU